MAYLYYSLDETDHIRDTGGAWGEGHDCPDDPSSNAWNILGNSIWQHIEGLETKTYLNVLFFAVREVESALLLPYRCNGPAQTRIYTMNIIPLGNGCIKVEHTGIPFASEYGQESAADMSQLWSTMKCSICCSVLVGTEWIDPIVHPEWEFPAGHGVCPSCKDAALNRTAEIIRPKFGAS